MGPALMCDSPADPRQVAAAVPRRAAGSAVDPIALEPVDEIVITTLVDNVYDALLTGDGRTTRAPFRAGQAPAPQFETGSTMVGLANGGSPTLGHLESAPLLV
jgi:7,8-dihydropterin-6-yl-methyl-4-(beta-D-ribofuranosyl)aminobenzene 5'-phosphate synthase